MLLQAKCFSFYRLSADMQAALFFGAQLSVLGKEHTAEKPLRRRFQLREPFWRVLAPWFGPHLMCPLLALRRQMLSLFLYR